MDKRPQAIEKIEQLESIESIYGAQLTFKYQLRSSALCILVHLKANRTIRSYQNTVVRELAFQQY